MKNWLMMQALFGTAHDGIRNFERSLHGGRDRSGSSGRGNSAKNKRRKLERKRKKMNRKKRR